MKKGIIWIIVIAVIIVIWLVLKPSSSVAPTPPANETTPPTGVAPSSDKTTAINQDLQSLNVSDLNKEFNQIDKDASAL